MIDLLASSPHYYEHLAPIWQQLETRGLSGDAYSARPASMWATASRPRRAALRGVQPVMVASYVDYQAAYPSPVVYVEHGAGQSYGGDPVSARFASYSGGDGLDRVILFLSPSESVAHRWRDRYPTTPAVAVGCPKLDGYHLQLAGERHRAPKPTLPAVALTYHWDCPLVAETLSAFRHYERCLPRLAEWAKWQGIELLGHSHPRIWRHLRGRYERAGIEPVESFDEVVARAGVLCFDNTSAGPEAASCGLSLVFMNAPWYRRDVEHGGRFWQWPRGQVQVDESIDLIAGIESALDEPDSARSARESMVRDVYAFTDGQAAARAADAIAALDLTPRGRPQPHGF